MEEIVEEVKRPNNDIPITNGNKPLHGGIPIKLRVSD